MSVVVVATIRPLPEHRDEVIAAFTETIAQVHAEGGCELYALQQADDRLIMVEKWTSREALGVHSRGRGAGRAQPEAGGQGGRPVRGHRARSGARRRPGQGPALTPPWS
ncbi:MAG: putative quinol monooxygenase [Streptosporangiaceae bacterium]